MTTLQIDNHLLTPDLTSPPTVPRCPYCGRAAEHFYRRDGAIIGCCECLADVPYYEAEAYL